jgi:hypothetical protein
MTPERIQRRRTKGWKMPENTVSVTRPGKWGNPFVVGDYVIIGNGGNGFTYIKTSAEYATSKYRLLDTIEKVIEAYKEYLEKYLPKDIQELKGKNLACFCAPGNLCHADVLLEIANRK